MQPRSEETRSRLLKSAMDSFSQAGFDATGVSEICERAGVSKGAFYHHFPSKQAIFLQLLEDWLSSLDRQLEEFREGVQSIPDTLMGMASLTEGIFQTASGALPMFIEFWSQASRDPDVWQTSIAPYRRYQKYFANLIKEGIEHGSLAKINPDSGSRMIVALAVGLLLQGLLDPDGADWARIAKDSMSYLIQGIQKRDS